MITRRAAVSALAASFTAAKTSFAQESEILLRGGAAKQGGALICRGEPRSTIRVDGEIVGQASKDGWFVVGLDRDAKPDLQLMLEWPNRIRMTHFAIAPVDYDIQRIDGLPQNTVTPQDPALLERIAQEAARKREGFASIEDADWFKDGFAMPLIATRVSGRFGGQRILNGTPSTPHYGADLAAPIGTVIRAPCEGIVSFAETGLHYEGGLTMIDHGQGLITAYLHQSKVEVKKGQHVRRGETIGAVGMEGRATGPHLCWRMKWRGRNCDPTLLVV